MSLAIFQLFSASGTALILSRSSMSSNQKVTTSLRYEGSLGSGKGIRVIVASAEWFLHQNKMCCKHTLPKKELSGSFCHRGQ